MLIRITDTNRKGRAGMRLLIVEDDRDGREMLAELFRMHAWEVIAVPTTDAAMLELRSGGFDVVISDEDLEGHSGSCMLRDAGNQGLLENMGALMYTADPKDLDVPRGVRVLRKPLGVTQLLDEAKAVAATPPSGERRRAVAGRVAVVVAPRGRSMRRDDAHCDSPPSSRTGS